MRSSKDRPTKTSADQGRRAVFLDRDGVLNVDHGYVHKVEDLALVPGAGSALAELRRRGFLLIVITNQSGVGRGFFAQADVEAFHAAMQELLQREHGVRLDAFYVCFDTPQAPSQRRKPAPGMVLEAASDLGIDLAASWLVGDRGSDVECAVAAGVRAVHVTEGPRHEAATAKARSLADALSILV